LQPSDGRKAAMKKKRLMLSLRKRLIAHESIRYHAYLPMSLICGVKKDIQEKPNSNLATVISETTDIII
jgi:hypothetical protein